MQFPQSMASAAEVAEQEVGNVRSCIAEGRLLDLWTQTPATELPRCIAVCPAESVSTHLGDQCISPDVYSTQLQLRFRLRVLCSSETSLCLELTSASAHASRRAVAEAAKYKIAQCLRLPWQEVNGGMLAWATDHQLTTFSYERDDNPGRIRRLMVNINGSDYDYVHALENLRSVGAVFASFPDWKSDALADGMANLFRHDRRAAVTRQNVEFAWRVDSYHLSPSAPSAMLRRWLREDSQSISSCLGFRVALGSLDWMTDRNGPDLIHRQHSFLPVFQFLAHAQNELPASTIEVDQTAASNLPVLETSTNAPSATEEAALHFPWIAPPESTASAPVPAPPPRLAVHRHPEIDFVSLLLYVLAVLFAAGMGFAGYRACTRRRRGRERVATKEAWTPTMPTGAAPHAARAAGIDEPVPGPGGIGRGVHPAGADSAGQANVHKPLELPVLSRPKAPKQFGVGTAETFLVAKLSVAAELQQYSVEPLISRRRRFKELCLQHHPDKNGNSPESKSVFQYLLAQKSRFLEDDEIFNAVVTDV